MTWTFTPLLIDPDSFAKLMSTNKGKTAVHGCHCLGDMVVHMCKVLAIQRSWYV